jgi:two-component sensor histidine kinase
VAENSVAVMSDPKRVKLAGPPVWLTPNLALALTLILHELATNSAKYGSLSVESGIVEIVWGFDHGIRELTLNWIEKGGPAVQPPTRQGFGTRLINKLVSAEAGGSVVMKYELHGLLCSLRVIVPPRKAGLAEA